LYSVTTGCGSFGSTGSDAVCGASVRCAVATVRHAATLLDEALLARRGAAFDHDLVRFRDDFVRPVRRPQRLEAFVQTLRVLLTRSGVDRGVAPIARQHTGVDLLRTLAVALRNARRR
jgi:hypothetical protein